MSRGAMKRTDISMRAIASPMNKGVATQLESLKFETRC